MTGAAGRGVSFSQRAQRLDLLPSRQPGQSPARPPGQARPNRPRPARLPLAPMAALGGSRRRPLVLLLFGERPGGGRGLGVRRLRGRAGPGDGGSGSAVRPGRAGCRGRGRPGCLEGTEGPGATLGLRSPLLGSVGGDLAASQRCGSSPHLGGSGGRGGLRAAAPETRTGRASVPAGNRAGGDPGLGSPSCGLYPWPCRPARSADMCSDVACSLCLLIRL